MEIQKPYEGAFVGDAHHFALRVYIEDTDLGGVVYYANYLRFLERARSDMLRLAGIDHRDALERGEGIYAVTEVRIKYLKPAKLDDELLIISRVDEIRAVSCVISQKVLRGQDLLTQATVKVAFLTPQGRPRRQPSEWIEKLERLRGRTG